MSGEKKAQTDRIVCSDPAGHRYSLVRQGERWRCLECDPLTPIEPSGDQVADQAETQPQREAQSVSAVCPRCLAPLAPGEIHDAPEDCMAAGWIPEEAPEAASIPRGNSAGELLVVPIGQVEVESNVRDDLGDLQELADSIKAEGLLQPISVHRKYELGPANPVFLWVVDHGHRRLAACRLAGMTEIPVIVKPAREGVDRPIAQLVENIQRADLNPLEEARAFEAILAADPDLTQKALADRLGRSAPYVSNALRLLELPDEVRELVATGKLSGAHAKSLASLPAAKAQELAREALAESWSTHELEEQIKWMREREGREAAKTKKRTVGIAELVAKLRERGLKPGASVYGQEYRLTDDLRKAIEQAGWKLRTSSSWCKPKGCDCEALMVSLSYDHKPVIEARCTEQRHLSAASRADSEANEAKRKACVEATERIRTALVERLRGRLDLEVARMAIYLAIGEWDRARFAQGRLGDKATAKDIWRAILEMKPDEVLAEWIDRTMLTHISYYGDKVPWTEFDLLLGLVHLVNDDDPLPARRRAKGAEPAGAKA